MPGGIYFLNCQNEAGDYRSGIAYYENMGENNNNTDEQPLAFQYTELNGRSNWESDDKQDKTFDTSSMTVEWQISPDAQSKEVTEQCGTCQAGDQQLPVKKDSGRYVFENFDGYKCYAIYYAMV